jgi:hypothetical protein
MRRLLVLGLFLTPVWAQDLAPGSRLLTAVYVIADHHTTRRTAERDPLTKIAGVCQLTERYPLDTLACAAPPVTEERTGRRYYYTVALLRDLDETVYLTACASLRRESTCSELQAGQTFSAEALDNEIRLVAEGQHLPLRILEKRPKPRTISSPTEGTPSRVRFSEGSPSDVPYSDVPVSRGAPSNVRPSEVSVTTGAPSSAPPSRVSSSVVSPGASRLYLEASAGPAEVYLDGQWVGYAPLNVPLLPGRHTIRVHVSGFEDWVQTIRLPPGETTRVRAELRR